MGDHYIELIDKKSYISKIVMNEELRFKNTLEMGLKVIDELFEKYKEKKIIHGSEIFKLYDTYGFPTDLLQDIAEDNKFELDFVGFNKEMLKQQERAKKSWAGSGDEKLPEVFLKIASALESKFDGYDNLQMEASVKFIVKGENECDMLKEGEKGYVITEITPFYPEGGGQIGDKGVIKSESGIFVVENTKKVGESVIIHEGKVIKGRLQLNDDVELIVDENLRKSTEKNHTATHLLHRALQIVLGDHVRQSGSLVNPERLRFDFAHFSPLSAKEIKRVEEIVNREIQRNLNVSKHYSKLQDAIKSGATALFGEKYGETVRVVKVADFSTELCGGCHIRFTGEIGVFKILSESSVAAGVRRIEAATGMAAFDYLNNADTIVSEMERFFKVKREKLVDKIKEIIEEKNSLLKELDGIKSKQESEKIEDIIKNKKVVNSVNTLVIEYSNKDIQHLRNIMDVVKSKLKSGVVLIVNLADDKVTFLCGVTNDLTDRYDANIIVKEVAKVTGGGGGGKKELAQAGGKDVTKIKSAIEKFYDFI
jgi:alanyl-tRNA synthetase